MNAIILAAAGSHLAERLAAWTGVADRALSENTKKAIGVDWRSYSGWCQERGLSALPATPATVIAYLHAEADAGRATATVRRRTSTIALAHRAAELPDPTKADLVRKALRGVAKQLGTKQRQAKPLTGKMADRIVGRIDAARPKDVRDLALILVGRDLLARSSELVSLTVEAITWHDEKGTALAQLMRGKTDTETHTYALGAEAAAALKRWLAVSGITTGRVFQGLTKGGRLTGLPLVPSDVSRVVKALAKRAKIETDFSSHSLRVGMAHDLVADNFELVAVMQAGGWRTPEMVARYTEDLAAEAGAVARYHARRHK